MPERQEITLEALQPALEGLFIPWPTSGQSFPDIAVTHDGQELDELWINVGRSATLKLLSRKTDLVLEQEGANRRTILRPALDRFCRAYRERLLAPHTRMERGALLALVEAGDREALGALLGLRPTNEELDAAASAFADDEARGRALSALSLAQDGMEIMLKRTDSPGLFRAALARERQWSDDPRAVAYLRDPNPYRAALAVKVAARQRGNLKQLVCVLPTSDGIVKESLLAVLRQSDLSDTLLLDLCMSEGPNARECLILGGDRLTRGNRLEQLKRSGSVALRRKAARVEERIDAIVAERTAYQREQLRQSAQEVTLFLQDLTTALRAMDGRVDALLQYVREQVPEQAPAGELSWREWERLRAHPSVEAQAESLRTCLRDFSRTWCERWFALEQRYPEALLALGRALRNGLQLDETPDRLIACHRAVEQFRAGHAKQCEAAEAVRVQ